MSIQIGELKPCPCCDGMLTAEHVCEAIFNNSSYASYDGARYYADGIRMQAVADELNARAERTCHETEIDKFFRGCDSCGWMWEVFYSFGKRERPNFCPNCGARVEEEK